jgi:ribulose-5-phosphate 4-epimerase/fuculose-1-phosphate aldolase
MITAPKTLRDDLAAAYRLAHIHGLNEGISNHFTARVSEDRFLVIPHGLLWCEVTSTSLLLVNGSGEVIEGAGEVEPSALFIHSRILRARPDAACVMHTHQPYATALTVLKDGRLLPVHQNSLRFHDRIAYESDYQGAADVPDEGERLARALGDKDVLFHGHHGVIVVAPTIAKAFDDLYFLERAAMVQILAQSTGGALEMIPDGVAEGYVSETRPNNLTKQANEHFAAWKRWLGREAPGYEL